MKLNGQRTLVLGSGPLARLLLQEIGQRWPDRFGDIGVVTESVAEIDEFEGCRVVGELGNFRRLVTVFRPELIIVAMREDVWQADSELLEASLMRNIPLIGADQLYESLTGKLAIEALTPRAVMSLGQIEHEPLSRWTARTISLVAAVAGGLLLAPLMMMIALLIKATSRGPVLFVQPRIGLHGETFDLYKFRTMRPEKDNDSEWARDNEKRITRVGGFLRKFRLDELPQFFNVIRGDMNLVGPRPHPASNFDLFMLVARNADLQGEQIPWYLLRSRVKPGITGWAQVRYQYANDVNEEMEKLRFDLYYVKHASFLLDMKILLETIGVTVLGRDAGGVANVTPVQYDDKVTSSAGQHGRIMGGVTATRQTSRAGE